MNDIVVLKLEKDRLFQAYAVELENYQNNPTDVNRRRKDAAQFRWKTARDRWAALHRNCTRDQI